MSVRGSGRLWSSSEGSDRTDGAAAGWEACGIGSDIADIMQMVTGAKDIAVFIEGCHSCMTARGIKKANTKTYTQTLRGRFNNESNGFVQWWNR